MGHVKPHLVLVTGTLQCHADALTLCSLHRGEGNRGNRGAARGSAGEKNEPTAMTVRDKGIPIGHTNSGAVIQD